MKIFISAGDYSGDIHMKGALEALQKISKDAHLVDGIAGPNCRALGIKMIADQSELSCLGFAEVIFKYLSIRKIFKERVVKSFNDNRYDLAILCDFYGFNIHVAALARSRGVPVYYFISPQVWASRLSRIQKIKRLVNKMHVIFPFEEKIYRESGIPVVWVGYPRIDMFKKLNGIPKEKIITVLPGSRPAQIARHLPVIMESIRRGGFHEKYQIYIIRPKNIPEELYDTPAYPWAKVEGDEDFSIRSRAICSVSSSGTSTLENALMAVPTVVIFRISLLTYLIAKTRIKVKYIAMPNILLDHPVFPELIQGDFTPGNVSASLSIMLSEDKLDQVKEKSQVLLSMLDKGNAYENFAGEVLKAAE